MSKISFFEKLLDGASVEWKRLDELATIGTGSSNRQDESENGNYPFYVRSKNVLKSDTFQFDETAIIIPGEGRIGEIFHFVSGKYALHQRAYRIGISSELVNPRFLFHFISQDFKGYILRKSVGATAASIRKPMLDSFEVPVPCPDSPKKSLEIQAEIVRILDSFTELTAELSAELKARKKQYNHYRDQLLSFEDGEVEWKTLGDVYQMRAGQHIKAAKISNLQTDNHPFRCFGGNGVRGYVEEKSHEGDYLLIGRQGALCGNVQRAKGPFYATEHAVVVTASDEMNVDWSYHMLTVMNLNQYASQSAQPGLAVGKLQSLRIPVPPLREQERVASILDKFDTLTTSLSEGLPREIELRQQQYEYYRDLLLSFPKPEEAA